jgi:hypothetical protein
MSDHSLAAYTLTVYIYPSPFGVNWKSPHHLTRSVLLNSISLKPRSIGHVAVELKRNQESVVFTGMTAQNLNHNRKLVLLEQIGLGSLFGTVPGMLEKRKKLETELEKRLNSGYFSFIHFKISQASFEKTLQYLNEFQQKKADFGYGLPNRPRHLEGAGCSAFTASVMEVANVMDSEFKENCSLTIRVPEEFLGGAGKKVPIWHLLFPNKTNLRWASVHEHGKDIYFWDPDLMHAFVQKKISAHQESKTEDFDLKYKIIRRVNTLGIEFDLEHQRPTDEPIWF